MLPQAEILEGEDPLLRSRLVPGREGQAAGLGAQAPVAAAPTEQRREITLAGYAPAEGAVDKYLQLTAEARAGGDFLRRHLPGQDHPAKAGFPQPRDPLGSVAGELGGGMQGHLRGGGAQTPGEAPVLHDQRIHPSPAGLFRQAQGVVHLVVLNQGVHGQIHPRPPDMTKSHRLPQ